MSSVRCSQPIKHLIESITLDQWHSTVGGATQCNASEIVINTHHLFCLLIYFWSC